MSVLFSSLLFLLILFPFPSLRQVSEGEILVFFHIFLLVCIFLFPFFNSFFLFFSLIRFSLFPICFILLVDAHSAFFLFFSVQSSSFSICFIYYFSFYSFHCFSPPLVPPSCSCSPSSYSCCSSSSSLPLMGQTNALFGCCLGSDFG